MWKVREEGDEGKKSNSSHESIRLEDKSYGCAQCVPASGSGHVLPLLGPQVPTGHLLFLLLLVCLSFLPQNFLCLPFPPPETGLLLLCVCEEVTAHMTGVCQRAWSVIE